MELKQVRYFLAVADAGSFSAGARRAFVTQPTLSVAIAALEAELGAKLFERRARGVVVTAEGERVLEHARAILRETEALKASGREAVPGKPLKLGLLPTLPPPFVAQTLSQLRALEPSRPWHMEDASIGVLHQRLTAGRYDAILTSLGRPEAGKRQVELMRDVQAVAVAKSERPRGRVMPTFLHGRPLIVRVHCEMLQAASRVLDVWHVQPHVVARTDSDARALAMVAAGIGACLLPDSFQHDGVAFVRPEGPVLGRRLGLEWNKDAAAGALDRICKGLVTAS